jgi:integrase
MLSLYHHAVPQHAPIMQTQPATPPPVSSQEELSHLCPFSGQSAPLTPSQTRMTPIPEKDAPTTVNGTVRFAGPPKRLPNRDRRSREHLTESEVDLLIETAKGRGRYGHRDATMILLAYRHGLRVSELVALRWDQVDLTGGVLHVNRMKRGTASVHPLRGPEIRALRRLGHFRKRFYPSCRPNQDIPFGQ